MSAYAGQNSSRIEDVAGTLRLLVYLALAIVLMVLDHRGGWLGHVRQQGDVVMQPVWWLAGLPGRIGESARTTARTHGSLAEENRILRNALLISGARNARLQTAAEENQRIRDLLGAARQGRLDVQLMPIMDVDMDPGRQRLLLAGGARDGVTVGQSVMDAGGLLGQVIAATPTTSTVLLLTDLSHAVPVEVARSGVRLVAYGKGRSDQMALQNIPLSSDVKVGDSVVTSGLGDRFPAGFMVGTITALRPDDSRAFLVGDLKPAAQLDRGHEVLLLRDNDTRSAAGPATTPQALAQADEAGHGMTHLRPTRSAEAAPSGVAFGVEVYPASQPAHSQPGQTPPAVNVPPQARPEGAGQ